MSTLFKRNLVERTKERLNRAIYNLNKTKLMIDKKDKERAKGFLWNSVNALQEAVKEFEKIYEEKV